MKLQEVTYNTRDVFTKVFYGESWNTFEDHRNFDLFPYLHVEPVSRFANIVAQLRWKRRRDWLKFPVKHQRMKLIG